MVMVSGKMPASMEDGGMHPPAGSAAAAARIARVGVQVVMGMMKKAIRKCELTRVWKGERKQ